MRYTLTLGLVLLAQVAGATDYYISPSGNNSNDGLSSGAPKKTFANVFGVMSAGDRLWLMDGTYSVAAGTGVIDPNGTNSAQPPSGISVAQPTIVQAVNPGSVKVLGYSVDAYSGTPLRLGRSTGLKRSYITVEGITFDNYSAGYGATAGWLFNTSYVTIKNCGFLGGFSVGSSDHNDGNTYNLIQDVWIASLGNRVMAINYRADNNVWRRVIMRSDGCGNPSTEPGGCAGSGNPTVGFSVYDSADVSVQNVVQLDRILIGADSSYGDFSTAQHTPGSHLLGRDEWLGTVSLNSDDDGFHFEADEVIAGATTIKMRNVVAWDTAGTGINIGGSTILSVDLSGLTIGSVGGAGLRVYTDPNQPTGTVTNIEVDTTAAYGVVVGAASLSYCNVFGASPAYHDFSVACTGSATTVNAKADSPVSLKYPLRVEADGATLHATGSGGADKGANIIYKYGTDNTRFGDSGYNTLTANLLWPWPNQTRIKQEMCTDLSITRGFCAGGLTLTGYVWNYLGNGSPYEGSAVVVTSASLPNGTVGVSYDGTACLAVTGGIGAPFTWSVTAGATPDGVTLGADGCWTGSTPTVANTFNFTAQACDAIPTCDTEDFQIIITPAPVMDATLSPGATHIIARFGKAGLPYSDSCNAAVKIGETTQDTFTSTSGFATRVLALTGLTASTAYNVDITCPSATANRVTTTTLATPSGGDRTVPVSIGAPSSVLPTAARVTVDYGTTESVADGSVPNTDCASTCTVNLTLPAGLHYWRVRRQTAADVVIATGAVQPLQVQ